MGPTKADMTFLSSPPSLLPAKKKKQIDSSDSFLFFYCDIKTTKKKQQSTHRSISVLFLFTNASMERSNRKEIKLEMLTYRVTRSLQQPPHRAPIIDVVE